MGGQHQGAKVRFWGFAFKLSSAGAPGLACFLPAIAGAPQPTLGKLSVGLEKTWPGPVGASMGASGPTHVALGSFSVRWGIPELLPGPDSLLSWELVFTFQSLDSKAKFSNQKGNPARATER